MEFLNEQMDPAEVLALELRQFPEVLRTALKIADWIKTTKEVWYGRGSKDGSTCLLVTVNGLKSTPLVLWTYGRVEIPFLWMRKPFDTPAKREELRERDGCVSELRSA